MRTDNNLYPALGRYFKNQTELAHAANRSRSYIWECLIGQREFTRADKKAISANIAMRLLSHKDDPSGFDYQEFWDAEKAWRGEFDEIYKRKVS